MKPRWTVLLATLVISTPAAQPQNPCVQPLCVNRADDSINPVPGMLRYALQAARDGAIVTFDSGLSGKIITLGVKPVCADIRVAGNVTIAGPGAGLLTVSGENCQRILFIVGGSVHISDITLANGIAKGEDGASATGGAGGGGGGAGLGGAIFQAAGDLTLSGVIFARNRAVGGSGGSPGAGLSAGNGGSAGGFSELGVGVERRGGGGSGQATEVAARNGATGGFGEGGGGGACAPEGGRLRGGRGGAGGFGGGAGGSGASTEDDGTVSRPGGGNGGAGMGGAVFVRSGRIRLQDVTFRDNAAIGGFGAAGGRDGRSSGGAVYVCSEEICGGGHDALGVVEGNTSFTRSTVQPGSDEHCPGRDDTDVCGRVALGEVSRLLVSSPPVASPGVPFAIRVFALDSNDVPVFTCAARARIEVSDAKATYPTGAQFAGGVGSIIVTLRTAGDQTVSVIDLDHPGIRGVSQPIAVAPD